MRWFFLTGLLFVSCLPPHSESVDAPPQLFVDFPELAGWGHVVLIGGQEYWRPDPAFLFQAPVFVRHGPAQPGWVPYGNGSFYEDPIDGIVWVSQDPWGFVTEHYGYWRHHAQLGYVWRPFYPVRWSPFVASILYDDAGHAIGLCPFVSIAWETGLYDSGFGFDDDYGSPYWRRVSVHGFYSHHVDRFARACVTVAPYAHNRDGHAERDRYAHRDREYRDRHGRRTPPEPAPPPQDEPPPVVVPPPDEPQRDAEPSEPIRVVDDLPAQPGLTPTGPAPGSENDPPQSPAELPTIPARDLDVSRRPTEPAPLPRAALETKDLRAIPPQHPADAEATVAPRPAAPPAPAPAAPPAPAATPAPATPPAPAPTSAPAATPAPEAAPAPAAAAAPPAASTQDTVGTKAAAAKDESKARDASAPVKKVLESRRSTRG